MDTRGAGWELALKARGDYQADRPIRSIPAGRGLPYRRDTCWSPSVISRSILPLLSYKHVRHIPNIRYPAGYGDIL